MEKDEIDDVSSSITNRHVVPMKKARFSWQVKGRSRSQIEDTTCSGSSGVIANSDVSANNVRHVTANNDNSEAHFVPCSNKRVSEPTITAPCYVDRQNSNDTVPTLRASACIADLSDDRGLARWQARQVAKGFVDNTINRVLDSFTEAPMPGHTGSLVVEDAAILMAISAHGLQNGAGPIDQSSQAGGTRDWQQPGSSGRELRRASESSHTSGGEHYDFLEAAVSVAIQKKGLAPLSHNGHS